MVIGVGIASCRYHIIISIIIINVVAIVVIIIASMYVNFKTKATLFLKLAVFLIRKFYSGR